MPADVTVGKGLLRLQRGCAGPVIVVMSAFSIFLLGSLTLWAPMDWGLRLFMLVLDLVLLIVLVVLVRVFRPLKRRLVVTVSDENLLIRPRDEAPLSVPRRDIACVEFVLDALGYIKLVGPHDEVIGFWETGWTGPFQPYRLKRALERFGYPVRKMVLNRLEHRYQEWS
jgi:hypothetical protein